MNNDRVNELYQGEIFTPEAQRICRERIHWMCAQIRGERVVDIGCSQGIASILAARAGHTVVGVDVEEPAIDYARRALAAETEAVQQRVTLLLADVFETDLGGAKFDTVLLGEILEHQAEPRALLERALTFLAPGGVLVLTTPFGYHPHDDHKVTFYLTAFGETVAGLCQPAALDVVDGYIRFVAHHRDAPGASLELDPTALLSLSQEAFLAKEVTYHRILDERARRLRRSRAEEGRLSKRLAALEEQSRGLSEKLQRERLLRASERKASREGLLQVNKKLWAGDRKQERQREELDTLRRELREARRIPILPPPAEAGPVTRAVGMLFGSAQHEVHTGRAFRRPHTAVLKTSWRVLRAFRGKPTGRPARAIAAPPAATSPAGAGPNGVVPGARAIAGDGPSFPIFEALVSPAPSSLTIATIFDTFSEFCFRYEAKVLPLSINRWREELEQHRPAFLLAESAWRGNGGQWQYLMSKYAAKPENPLRDLLAWCKGQGLPTVFWNKEDPANFEVFKDVAADFDIIFTTDEDCIPRYRALVGHQRVYALPFAAQPAIHNPMQDVVSRSRNVCFAGSWRADKYPERVPDTEALLTPALEFDLDVFDRFAGTKDAEKFAFPPPYSGAVRGSLDYAAMLSAYRGYKAFLNVNSVKDSPTMFARRVFELMACGTPVISSESVGIRAMLGSLVKVAATKDEARRHLEQLLGDDDYRRRFAHVGYREVLSRHTYSHRLRAILDAVGIEAPDREAPLVTILAATNRPDRLDNLVGTVRRQIHPNLELIVLLNSDEFDEAATQRACGELSSVSVKVLKLPESYTLAECLNEGLDHATGAWIAKIDDDDYYGPHYLSDLLLATQYTDAPILGKRSYYCYLEGGQQFALRFPDHEHRHVAFVHGGTLLVRRDVFEKVRFTPVARGTDTIFLRECREDLGLKIYSADPYNFIHVRHADLATHTWQITDAEILAKCRVIGPGLDMGEVMI
jgi:spore maturation protein CgeB/2-polyprenyl-3-methyl-5-hydroxy-6-metoxy-1,4-benzoquinol methylase